jgi:hypothetical protein
MESISEDESIVTKSDDAGQWRLRQTATPKRMPSRDKNVAVFNAARILAKDNPIQATKHLYAQKHGNIGKLNRHVSSQKSSFKDQESF